MTWFQQVAHVMKKDLRQHRWMIGLALVAMGVVTVRVVSQPALPDGAGTGLGAVLTSLAGGFPMLTIASGLLVAFLIQSDSPARSDAFWVTRPLAPSAVAAAKLTMMALVLVALPLIGQGLALRGYGVEPDRMTMLLAQSALAQAAILTVAAGVAALTRDLRTFLVALFLTIVGENVAMEIVRAAVAPDAAPLSPWVSGALVTVLGLALVAYQYRVRDVRRTLRMCAVPAVGCVALLGWLQAGHTEPAGPSIPPSLRPAGIQVTLDRVEPRSPSPADRTSMVSLSVQLSGAPAAVRYALIDMRFVVHRADGRLVPSTSTFGEGTFINWARTELGGVEWLDDPPLGESGRGRVGALVPWEVAEELAEGTAWLELTGRMEANRSREMARLPSREGARAAVAGRRFDVVAVTDTEGAPFLTAVTRLVAPVGATSSFPTMSSPGRTDVALIDPAGTEGLFLRRGNASGGRGSPLVLPGLWTGLYLNTFQPLSRPGAPTPDPPAWLPDARLAVFEWLPIGSYPVSFDVRGGIKDDTSPAH